MKTAEHITWTMYFYKKREAKIIVKNLTSSPYFFCFKVKYDEFTEPN